MFRRIATILPFAFYATLAQGEDFQVAEAEFLEASIRPWISEPKLLEAIKAANAERADFDQAKIDAMDAAWRAEVGTGSTPTITPVLTNAASEFLRAQVEASAGTVIEAFVTDAKGLNVAVSEPTSDMWQGDEPKFTEVFPKGKDGVLFSPIELDESTQAYAGQISITITDPATGEAIGTLTVSINAESLM